MVRRTYYQALEDATYIAKLSLAANNLRYAGKLHILHYRVEYVKTRTKIARLYRARLKQIARRTTLTGVQRDDINQRVNVASLFIANHQHGLTVLRGQLRNAIRQANHDDLLKRRARVRRFMEEFAQIPQDQIEALRRRAENVPVQNADDVGSF